MFKTDAVIIDALRTLVFVLSRTALTFGLMIRCFLTAAELYVNDSSSLLSSEVVSSGSESISWQVNCDFGAEDCNSLRCARLSADSPSSLASEESIAPRYSQNDLCAAEPGIACPLQTELNNLREHELCETIYLV